jgi:hypothetical protein
MLAGAAANAAHVDMKDPRRALGRDDDVRIDAQLFQDTLEANGPISITYQIENLSSTPIAIADRVVDVDFNRDDAMVTVSIGAEALTTKTLPHLVIVAPGEKKTFKSGGTVRGVQSARGPFVSVPHAVQIRVNILRDIGAFRKAIVAQQQPNAAVAVTDEMFDRWIDSSNSIDLNALPVKWSASQSHESIPSAEEGPSAGHSNGW